MMRRKHRHHCTISFSTIGSATTQKETPAQPPADNIAPNERSTDAIQKYLKLHT
jgi:hypothetical protein